MSLELCKSEFGQVLGKLQPFEVWRGLICMEKMALLHLSSCQGYRGVTRVMKSSGHILGE